MRALTWIVALAGLVGVVACQPASETAAAGSESLELVIARVPADRVIDATATTPEGRYPAGSEIVLVRPQDETRTPRLLSRGFVAAGAPEVAPDGRRVAFAGRRENGTAWGIYELDIEGSTPVAITEGSSDCIDPGYVGGGGLVFSCRLSGPNGDDRWELFRAPAAGSPPRRITFTVGSASWPSTLGDGRILFTLRSPAGGGLFVVNPDGTQLEPFAATHDDSGDVAPAAPIRARQTFDGGVLFLDSRDLSHRRLERVDMNRPLSSRRALLRNTMATSDNDGQPPDGTTLRVHAAEPLSDGSILLAADTGPGTATLGIYRWSREGGLFEVWNDADHHELEAVPLGRWPMPRGRPSPVDPSVATGQLLGLDAGHGDGIYGPAAEAPRVAQVEIIARWTQQEQTVRIPARPDGSFFVEVPADRPLRVRTLDDGERPIATSDWFWLRPGEIRTCFGCHEPREQAPPNRLVQAISDPPLTPWLDGADGGRP